MDDFIHDIIGVAADVGIPEVAAVQTPGRKERAKILKKRKALVDEATVVPNKYVIDFPYKLVVMTCWATTYIIRHAVLSFKC